MTRTTLVTLGMLLALGGAGTTQEPVEPLAGVTTVTVDILINTDDPLPTGITDQRLRTLSELRLRALGIRVLTPQEDRTEPGTRPVVSLGLTLIEAHNDSKERIGYAFSTHLAVQEFARSTRNKALVTQELWSSINLNTASPPNAAAEIERVVNALLDQLANAWLKANPRAKDQSRDSGKR
jgi:hypothetical protein